MNAYPSFELTESDESRFWAKVALPNANGCMLWLGAIDGRGYGVLLVASKTRKAHRVSLLMADGLPPSPRSEGAHACRNRHCVAPTHLRWATRSENIADKVRDGTDQFGERNTQAVLTTEQIKQIRQRYAAGGILQKDLGEEFGVHRASIGAIVTGVNWSHLSGDDAPVTIGGPPASTHCVNGHEFTAENTFLRRERIGRECRTCMRESTRRSRQRAKGGQS